jgi:hypothetical protein
MNKGNYYRRGGLLRIFYLFVSENLQVKIQVKNIFSLLAFYLFEPRLQVSQNRVPRRIFGFKGEEDIT